MTCPVCSWSGDAPGRGTPYITWCPGCRTGLTVPPPQRDVTTEGMFAVSYADRLAQRETWRNEARARVEWLQGAMTTPGPVLEIGAATGEFVEAAAAAGLDVVGVEPSTWAAEAAQVLTDRVFTGLLSDYRDQNPDRRFAGVVMFHVLEHIPEPKSLLREVRDVLAPGGVLVVEVPNGGALTLSDDGREWWAASLHDHVHHFRAGGITRLLEDSGFAVDATEWSVQSAYGAAPPSPRQRLRTLVKERRFTPALDLLRVVARPA